MSYKVLYRKYRPKNFVEIIGEETITNSLKQSIKENSISHAFIFTGPRGTGKTSTAKVLAKTINCTNIKDGEACGECQSCLNFQTSPDIIEIDAASNNGVDEIRELRTNVTLAPSASKYKIYIIDEVHMLTTGAFNALLKTLEEPPSHAIFILATTEVYKVPITILSRCQRYDFKKLSQKDLVGHLKYICEQEKIDYEEEALFEIYELSDGCARDALSVLDQMSKLKKKLSLESILNEYNIISNNVVEELLTGILNCNAEFIIDKINNFENSGMNAQKVIKKMINCLDNIALNIKSGKEQKFPFETVSHLIHELNQCYIDARINQNVYSLIKLSFLEQIKGEPAQIKKDIPKKENIEKPIQSDIKEEIVLQNKKALSIKEIRTNNCFVEACKEELKKLIDFWSTLENGSIKSIDIKDYTPVASSSTNAIFTAEEGSLADLFNIKHLDIEKILKKNKINVKVIALTHEEWNAEKNKFKIRLKNKEPYQYIDEPKVQNDGEKIKNQVEDLFTEKLIEIS